MDEYIIWMSMVSRLKFVYRDKLLVLIDVRFFYFFLGMILYLILRVSRG